VGAGLFLDRFVLLVRKAALAVQATVEKVDYLRRLIHRRWRASAQARLRRFLGRRCLTSESDGTSRIVISFPSRLLR
jgi:hypothetical protein